MFLVCKVDRQTDREAVRVCVCVCACVMIGNFHSHSSSISRLQLGTLLAQHLMKQNFSQSQATAEPRAQRRASRK